VGSATGLSKPARPLARARGDGLYERKIPLESLDINPIQKYDNPERKLCGGLGD
jgi:hypothetical protein